MKLKRFLRALGGCGLGASLLLFSSVCHGQISGSPPTLSIEEPTNGETVFVPTNIQLSAGIRYFLNDSFVPTNVEFFAGTKDLGKGTFEPILPISGLAFELIWSNPPPGGYSLTAVATGSGGVSATSAPVSIIVQSKPPPPPPVPYVYIYTPANGAVYHAPTNITIYARAVDISAGGPTQVIGSNTISSVEFFENKTLLGVATSSSVVTNMSSEPFYALTWSNVPSGAISLQAIAIDTNGNSATSSVVSITVYPPPPDVPLAVAMQHPTNGQSYVAPATFPIRAFVADSNVVETVQYFAGATSIGTVTNHNGVLLTNINMESPFLFEWTNVPAGSYSLTAVAVDTAGHTATSAPVTITVTPAPPPTPYVYIYSPPNGAVFHAPTNLTLYARALETGGAVASVEFLENNAVLGLVPSNNVILNSNLSSAPLFPFTWSNVPPGAYALKVVAFDTNGNSSTSLVVNITVVSNPPPPNIPIAVSIWYPTNGQSYVAPANIGIRVGVADSNVVQTAQFFSGASSLGTVTNKGGLLLTNLSAVSPFYLYWTNVSPGTYTLSVVATDSAGNTATSGPVVLYVLATAPPVVTIYATDPVAVAGTNYTNGPSLSDSASNYSTGRDTATFLVQRNTGTNSDLTVNYSIGGTASNGVDYGFIPGYVTIPAGRRYSLVSIVPIINPASSNLWYHTVILGLTAPTNLPPIYTVGSPSKAGAVILQEKLLPIVPPMIRNMPDNSTHVSLPAPNGMSYSVQISTDLVNWFSICTNTVLKGSAQYVDPNGGGTPSVFYRIISAPPPSY